MRQMSRLRANALGVMIAAMVTGSARAETPPPVQVGTGRVVRVALKLSASAADMHAMEVRMGDGSEMPAWFYDRKDKGLERLKSDDVVEITFVSVPNERDNRKRNRNDIREIRKIEGGVPMPAPTDGPTGARAQAERVRLNTAIGTGQVARAAAYTARNSLVSLFQGSLHPNLAKIADGAYAGSCFGYLGPNRVTVTVKDHRIADVSVQSRDDRPMTSLQAIPKAIVSKQGIRGVDAVTGATITSQAIMAAAGAALKDAEK